VINPLNNNPLNTNANFNPLNTNINVPMQVNILGGGLSISNLPQGNLGIGGIPSSHRIRVTNSTENNDNNIKEEIQK